MALLEDEPREADDRLSPPADAERREQFIPLGKADLQQTLAERGELAPAETAAFDRFCRMLQILVYGEFHAALDELTAAYAPFDPDRDTRPPRAEPAADRDAMRARLYEKFSWLLARGNFVRLAQAEIDAALSDRSHWGLHLTVDFERFEHLELYCRGDTIGTRYRRRLWNRFRPEEVAVPMYQRLVVIFRLRPGRISKVLDTEAVYIKLFKEIPKPDLDMLLPETKVKMTLLDRARVTLPTLTGVGIAISKIVVAGLSLPFFAALVLVGGTLGYGVRSLYGYLNTRQKYQLNLTQSLYYQNIDNNAGVIHRLLDAAQEQEVREVMLAYFFLWRDAGADGWTADELDRHVERFLHGAAALAVDFEIADALDKLRRFNLVEPAGDRWKAVGVEQAIERLADCWRRLPEAIG